MPDLVERATAIRSQYNSCFGCGLDNPIGLHLDDFEIAADSVTARFRPRQQYSGFAGVLHGGIIATLLDEAMAWTAMLLERTFVVTANLELKYRKPAPADALYDVRGTMLERRGRRLRIAGEAHVGSTMIAQANGLFLATEPIED